ncbi:hypothetical protein TNCV_3352071 [Trichonephila clavipes]|nr:hypothetical protein TNCV_3352071 [Trichonephila clavipes]
MRSLIRFLNAKNSKPVEISHGIVEIYCENVTADGMLHNIPSFLLDAVKGTRRTRHRSVQASLCKMSLDYFRGNSSSRHSCKVSSKLRSHCPPLSS